ncbi:MAG: AMP-binding enzyme [Lasallia pustulata]|uniref:AMP-binding enzyme n=1 Tax=Lasallia pustulata TaxID=136370 RepID=A0A5M8PMS8_9LECA|nr:MAG: AMP-binding enzyme [Lasallia pustulata]
MANLVRAKEIAVPPPVGSPYSVPLPGSEQEGRSKVYRHWRFPDELLKTLDPMVTTGHEMFDQVANRQPTHRCLGQRPYDPATKTFGPYQWMDYQTVQRRRKNFGIGIVELHKQEGVTEEKYGVGLWCQNRPEWQITDLACMSQSLFTVSLYDTLGPSATEYIIKHASLVCIVTSLPHIPVLLRLKPQLPTLKIIICLDDLDGGERKGYSKFSLLSAFAEGLDVSLYSMAQVETLGASLAGANYNPPKPSDTITINYTSGTTGPPKGVVLTHANAVAAASCSLITVIQGPSDVFCSYLPLAHIYARLTEQGALWAGASIGYYHGDILSLVEDLKLLRPTAFNSVPRLYNRFGGAIRAATTDQSGLGGALARHIVSTKLEALKDAESPSATNKHAIYDRLWGRKVASALGLERATTMVSGSAPLDPSLHQFLRVVFGNHFLQGYGLTETYAVSLGQLSGDFTAGNCGAVTPSMEVCLASVPDMEYLVTDTPHPRGELLLRGHALFEGYFHSPEETAKAVLPDGWFRTGDICKVDGRGRFTVIDRVKNVLKLAQGEYISPERIENVYLSHLNWLSQAYVHGDSVQMFLVGVFGVVPELFAPWAGRVLGREIRAGDEAAVRAACAEKKVRRAVVAELERVGRKERFAGFEKVKACWLGVEPFTIENELLTPTLKLKRPQTAKKFRAELDQLYAEALAEEELGKGKPRARL